MASLISSTGAKRTVKLGDLWLEHENFKNPRQFTGLEQKKIDDLAESVTENGLTDPPKVQMFRHTDGNVYTLVIDGQRRIISLRDKFPKNTEIPVIDLTEEPIELTPEAGDELIDKALTTLMHEGLSSFELVQVALSKQNLGKSMDEIGKSIGRSKTWVSRMLAAYKAASPKLLTQWRKGELSDEQFKDLAEIKDQAEQDTKAKAVSDARKTGDKTEARTLAKEAKETARKSDKDKGEKLTKFGQKMLANGHNETNGAGKVKPTVSGPQITLFDSEAEADRAAKREAEPVSKPPSKIALEEILAMADKRPPTADYVKGLMDGVKHAVGRLEMDKFAKAWHQYVNRIEGKPAKKAKPAKIAKAAKPAKVAKPAKKIKAKR